jgi:hypothetical protein
MKQRIPPLIQHQEHECEIRPTNKQNGYYYHCVKCNVWIAWLSKIEAEMIQNNT